MSRHGNGGADNSYGDGAWLPGGYGGEPAEDDVSVGREPAGRGSGAHRRPPGPTQTSPGDDSPTGPPWEQPGWDDTGVRGPGLDPGALAGQHPSDPLPSLPPPPPAEGGWAEPQPGFGYPGDAGHEPAPIGAGHTDGGYGGDRDDDTGYGYAGYPGTGYDPDGYPEAGYRPGYDDTGTGYPVTGDVIPVTAGGFDDTGTGYFDPVYGDGQFPADAGRYPDGGAYQAGDDGQYLQYDEHTAGHRGQDDDHSWYPDEQPDWAQDDDDSGFLPGIGTGGRGGDEDRAAERVPGRGGAGPGKNGPGRAGARQAGTGQARGGGKSGGGKRKSGIRRLAPWLALSVVLALLIGAGGGYYYVYTHYLHPPDFSGPGTGSLVVRIYPGDTAVVVGQRLQRESVVASARAFSNAAKVSGQGSALEPGYYRVHLHMNAALAFALLLKPSARVQTKITIPEGWRLSQIIAALGQATGNPNGYQQAIKDVAALNLPSFAHGNPEGYLFPATYAVQPNTPPIKVLQAMVTRFGQEAASVSLPAAAAHAQLTEADVITVASLIQAEGRNPADFPKIARVIYNRLNANPQMPLQLDSTVMFALHRYGIIASAQQIKVKSPYNTYLHTGLPPGPIDSPGDAAIKAALHPAQGTWTYFVTVDPKTGLTKFTSSFTQFEQFRAQLEANLAKGK
jgi:peptidoglycan lytic transglycosylase G